MSLFELWLITAIPSFASTVSVMCGIGIFVVVAVIGVKALAADVSWGQEKKEKSESLSAFIKKAIPRGIAPMAIAIALMSLVPSERQIYTIIGGYVATNAEGVSKLPDNLVGAANKFLEQYAADSGNDGE